MSTLPMEHHAELMRGMRPEYRIRDGEDFPAWQSRARARLSNLLGLPLPKSAGKPRISEGAETEAYREYRMIIPSEPGYEAVACLRFPKARREGKVPLVVCLQGHSTGMHISLGRPLYPGDEQDIAEGDRDFAKPIVEQGFAALALEQRAFGECGGTPKGPACHQPAMTALLMGRTLIGERVWDVSRALDAALLKFPVLDEKRVAIMGNSGGGTTAVYAAAMDARIAAAMPSCAFCGYYPSIGAMEHCVCNFVPGILCDFDMGDLAGLIAPRALITVSGRSDPIFPLESAKTQMEIARRYYRMAGAEENARHVIGEGGHRFYAEPGWRAFRAVTGW